MGFITGNVYDIKSQIQMVRKGDAENIMCICIYDKNSKAWCPYESLESVTKNWMFYDSKVTRDILIGNGLRPLY